MVTFFQVRIIFTVATWPSLIVKIEKWAIIFYIPYVNSILTVRLATTLFLTYNISPLSVMTGCVQEICTQFSCRFLCLFHKIFRVIILDESSLQHPRYDAYIRPRCYVNSFSSPYLIGPLNGVSFDKELNGVFMMSVKQDISTLPSHRFILYLLMKRG